VQNSTLVVLESQNYTTAKVIGLVNGILSMNLDCLTAIRGLENR